MSRRKSVPAPVTIPVHPPQRNDPSAAITRSLRLSRSACFGSSSGGTPLMASNRHRPTIPVPTKGPTDCTGDSDASAGDAPTGGDDDELSGGGPSPQETPAIRL